MDDVTDFKYGVNTSTEGGLFTHGTFETNGVENSVPAKAIPVKKLTQQDQIYETARGVAEVYHTVDTEKLEAYSDSPDTPAFLHNLEAKQQHRHEDEVLFTFFGYTDTHAISEAEARSLAQLSASHSDVIIAPLQPQILKVIRRDKEPEEEYEQGAFPVYRSGIERFLEAVSDLDTSKPVMGVMPLLSDGQMNELLTLYEDFDVDMLCVNLEGNTLLKEQNHVKLRQLIGRMSALRVFEGYLLYALNPPFPQYRQNETIRTAHNFVPVGMGFDVVGHNHIGLGYGPDGTRDNYNVYDTDVAGYKPVPVDDVVEEWPVTVMSRIDAERVADLGVNRASDVVDLISSEQLDRSFDELRDRIEQGNERNFLRSKEGIIEQMRSKFEATATAFENGANPSVGSY